MLKRTFQLLAENIMKRMTKVTKDGDYCYAKEEVAIPSDSLSRFVVIKTRVYISHEECLGTVYWNVSKG